MLLTPDFFPSNALKFDRIEDGQVRFAFLCTWYAALFKALKQQAIRRAQALFSMLLLRDFFSWAGLCISIPSPASVFLKEGFGKGCAALLVFQL
jgi:hypothetical protein